MEKGDATFVTRTGQQFSGDLGQDIELEEWEGQVSQSTLLLQKKKEMKLVQQDLDRKKLEYNERMQKCFEKEKALMQRVWI
jgi:hypothetical protein